MITMTKAEYIARINEHLLNYFNVELSEHGEQEMLVTQARYSPLEVIRSVELACKQYGDDLPTTLNMIPRILANRKKALDMVVPRGSRYEEDEPNGDDQK